MCVCGCVCMNYLMVAILMFEIETNNKSGQKQNATCQRSCQERKGEEWKTAVGSLMVTMENHGHISGLKGSLIS